MASLYKYRIWCNTESIWVESWDEEEPTVCPNNNTHSINSDKTSILEVVPESEPRDRSNKMRVHETSRKLGLATYWTGAGDDPTDVTDVGGGESVIISHTISGSMTETKYIDFNIIENETWLHEGYMTWDNCNLDTISLEMVPRTVNYVSSSNTYYNLYGGYLVIPAAGDGTIDIVSDITTHSGGLVYMPANDLGDKPSAFWNADWNSTTKEFENISAAPAGNGDYNMFTVEVPLTRFVNKLPFVKSGFICLQSADVDQVGSGMRLKFTAYTNEPDHDWCVACLITTNRDKTV